MKRLPRPTTFHGLLTALSCLTLCVPSNSQAQVQVMIAQGDCSEHAPCVAMAQQQGTATLDMEGNAEFGPAQVHIVSTAGMAGLPETAAAIKNEPYQAQAVTEMKQTLADGSHIDQTTTATVARDSDGRTVRVQKLSAMGPWKDASAGTSQTLTTIFDPVAQEHIDYTSDSKIAHVLVMPPLPPGGVAGAETRFHVATAAPPGDDETGFFLSGGGPVTAVAQGYGPPSRALPPQASKGTEPKVESLGTSTIEGLQVTGTRITKTIPAGTIGNDKDLNITHETWYSPELKLVIQSTQSDPRFGQTTYTLKNIQQGSPDVTLFQVPPNYTIDKIGPKFVKAGSQ
jgi:hypothetical protein